MLYVTTGPRDLTAAKHRGPTRAEVLHRCHPWDTWQQHLHQTEKDVTTGLIDSLTVIRTQAANLHIAAHPTKPMIHLQSYQTFRPPGSDEIMASLRNLVTTLVTWRAQNTGWDPYDYEGTLLTLSKWSPDQRKSWCHMCKAVVRWTQHACSHIYVWHGRGPCDGPALTHRLRLGTIPLLHDLWILKTIRGRDNLPEIIRSLPRSLWSQAHSESVRGPLLNALCVPGTDLLYAGFTEHPFDRMEKHFKLINDSSAGRQLPGYSVIRREASSTTVPAANVFFIPLCKTLGDRQAGLRAELRLIGAYNWRLNAVAPTGTRSLVKIKPTEHVQRDDWRTRHAADTIVALDAGLDTRFAKKRRHLEIPPTIPNHDIWKAPSARIMIEAFRYKAPIKDRKRACAKLVCTRSRHLLCLMWSKQKSILTLKEASHLKPKIKARASRLKLQLPLNTPTIALPWLGGWHHKRLIADMSSTLYRGMRAAGLLQISAIDPTFRKNSLPAALVRWVSFPSLFSRARNAGRMNKEAFMCSGVLPECTCNTDPAANQPKVRGPDGHYHVCARQSEIDWSYFTQDCFVTDVCTQASVKTRVAPTPTELRKAIWAAAYTMYSAALDPWRPKHLAPADSEPAFR